MNWQASGSCAQPGVDPELHFPVTSAAGRLVSPAAVAQAIEAIRMCNGCPVLTRCREWGMTEPIGIWGGLTEQDRIALRRGERPSPFARPRKSVDELLVEIDADLLAKGA